MWNGFQFVYLQLRLFRVGERDGHASPDETDVAPVFLTRVVRIFCYSSDDSASNWLLESLLCAVEHDVLQAFFHDGV